MFNGDSDNPGTYTEKLKRCKNACLIKQTPESSSWPEFGSTMPGLVMKSDGRCYCEDASSSTCQREDVGGSYMRYDFVQGAPDPPSNCY